MPCLTKYQKRLKKACEAKSAHNNIKYNADNIQINVDNASDSEDSDEEFDNADNFSVPDEPVRNDNAVSIVKKLQEAAKRYHQEHASHEIYRLRYIGNSVRTKRRKNQQQRKAAKGILTLHTLWNKKSTEVDDERSDDDEWSSNDNINGQMMKLRIVIGIIKS
jgi:hypothetical protein